jgi:vacuolar-type H+-ATPase subunit H
MSADAPHEYQVEIKELAKATANRLAKLGKKQAPRKRKAIIEDAAKQMMEISLRMAFDQLARAVIHKMATNIPPPPRTRKGNS